MSLCNHGCVKLCGLIEEVEAEGEDIDYDDPIFDTPCGKAYLSYAIASYIVSKNYLECLKTLHRDGSLCYHSDIQVLAKESGSEEVLEYTTNNKTE